MTCLWIGCLRLLDAGTAQIRTPRDYTITRTFDSANRLTDEDLSGTGLVGEDTREFTYNAANLLLTAETDYAKTTNVYDDFLRLEKETQEIALNGDGHANGWVAPIHTEYVYDLQGNPTHVKVKDPGQGDYDLDTIYSYDVLNRVNDVDAKFFDAPSTSVQVAQYRYFGGRLQSKRLGPNQELVLTVGYDTTPRVATWKWEEAGTGSVDLISLAYAYDDVDNPLYTRHRHDNDFYENYAYNARYELTDVSYRESSSQDYRTSYTQGTIYGEYVFDDNYNRSSIDADPDPFGNAGNETPSYTVNAANEYTAITGSSPSHDRDGNMTTLPSRPATALLGGTAGSVTDLTAEYDGLNRLWTVDAGGSERESYRYDAAGRRTLKLSDQGLWVGLFSNPHTLREDSVVLPYEEMARRYIYAGWSVVAERLLSSTDVTLTVDDGINPTFMAVVSLPGPYDGKIGDNYLTSVGGWTATVSAIGASMEKLERVYVNGPSIDEPLQVHIDGNGDRDIADNTNALPDPIHGGVSMVDGNYYYLADRMGTIHAIAAVDNDETQKAWALEYYAYDVYGQPTMLPIVDVDGGGNGIDDEQAELDANNTLNQTTWPSNGGATQYWSSNFKNAYLHHGRRYDENTGLYYNFRYYDPTIGRFISRDVAGYAGKFNFYQSLQNNQSRNGKHVDSPPESYPCCCVTSIDVADGGGWTVHEDGEGSHYNAYGSYTITVKTEVKPWPERTSNPRLELIARANFPKHANDDARSAAVPFWRHLGPCSCDQRTYTFTVNYYTGGFGGRAHWGSNFGVAELYEHYHVQFDLKARNPACCDDVEKSELWEVNFDWGGELPGPPSARTYRESGDIVGQSGNDNPTGYEAWSGSGYAPGYRQRPE